MSFGEKLQALRKQHYISQEELAEKLDNSRSAVSRWETDQCMPEVDKLLAISELFSVSLDYLLKDKIIDSDCEAVIDFKPLKKLFWICIVANMTGCIAANYGWHMLQSPFFVVVGIILNVVACLFFEILQPKKSDKIRTRYVRKRFYAANALILLPTPIYIAIEIIGFGDYYDRISPHIIPFFIYMVAVVGVAIYLIYQNRK